MLSEIKPKADQECDVEWADERDELVAMFIDCLKLSRTNEATACSFEELCSYIKSAVAVTAGVSLVLHPVVKYLHLMK